VNHENTCLLLPDDWPVPFSAASEGRKRALPPQVQPSHQQRETALSQAKSNALEEAFKALSKDRLFVNLYFQNSTVYSRTEFGEPKEERTFTGGYKISNPGHPGSLRPEHHPERVHRECQR
jgi:hypothetical protein